MPSDNGHMNLDVPAVLPDTALELMAHYLQMAHSFFQLIPEDREQNREELLRLLNAQYAKPVWKDGGGVGYTVMESYHPDAPEIQAAIVWLDKMEDLYETMRQEDEA